MITEFFLYGNFNSSSKKKSVIGLAYSWWVEILASNKTLLTVK